MHGCLADNQNLATYSLPHLCYCLSGRRYPFYLFSNSDRHPCLQFIKIMTKLVMCFITVISSLSQAIPAPPAKFSPCLCRGWKKNITLHHLHSIRIIILRNALQSPWEVRGMKHRGNHLPPVIISHPSAVLEEDPGGLGGSHVQPTDRQRKGLSWLQCPESISDLSRLLAALQLLWGLAAHEHQPYVLSVRLPLIHTELVTPKMRELLKIPEQAPFGF